MQEKLDRGGGLLSWPSGEQSLRQTPFPARAQAPSIQMATKSVSAAGVVLPVSGVGPAAGGGGLTMERLIQIIRAASHEERVAMAALLAAAPVAEKRRGRAQKVVGKKVEVVKEVKKAADADADADADATPDVSDYRIPADEIDKTVCVGRILKGGGDKRWSPIIYRESQCGAALEEESDLCAVCARREQKYGETGKIGDWAGRVTEEPLDESHMLGTAWAEKKKPRFAAAPAPAPAPAPEEMSEAASECGSSSETVSIAKPKAKSGRKPMSAEEKKAKAEAKAVAKAEAKAAKEAEKAAAKAVAAKSKKSKVTTTAPVAAPPAAASAVPPAVEEVEGFLTMVQGNMYWRHGTNLYDYDEALEKPGAYRGQWVDAGEEPDIDMDAPEVAAAESDTE